MPLADPCFPKAGSGDRTSFSLLAVHPTVARVGDFCGMLVNVLDPTRVCLEALSLMVRLAASGDFNGLTLVEAAEEAAVVLESKRRFIIAVLLPRKVLEIGETRRSEGELQGEELGNVVKHTRTGPALHKQ